MAAVGLSVGLAGGNSPWSINKAIMAGSKPGWAAPNMAWVENTSSPKVARQTGGAMIRPGSTMLRSQFRFFRLPTNPAKACFAPRRGTSHHCPGHKARITIARLYQGFAGVCEAHPPVEWVIPPFGASTLTYTETA
jgi:hypothetical protein